MYGWHDDIGPRESEFSRAEFTDELRVLLAGSGLKLAHQADLLETVAVWFEHHESHMRWCECD